MEIYARTPDNIDIVLPSFTDETTQLTLLFHGSRDHTNPMWSDIQDALITRAFDAQVVFYDWSQGANNRVRAGSNARALGETLGAFLGQHPSLTELTLIAHSAGAAVLEPLCRAARNTAARPLKVRMVFLDPYAGHGFLDRGFGVRTYGQCADFAVSYLNTSDAAPTTNRPLENAYNIDVTSAPGHQKALRGGHYWPLDYFLSQVRAGDVSFTRWSHRDWPRGAIETIQ